MENKLEAIKTEDGVERNLLDAITSVHKMGKIKELLKD